MAVDRDRDHVDARGRIEIRVGEVGTGQRREPLLLPLAHRFCRRGEAGRRAATSHLDEDKDTARGARHDVDLPLPSAHVALHHRVATRFEMRHRCTFSDLAECAPRAGHGTVRPVALRVDRRQ